MRRPAAALLLLATAGCEEPYYGDVTVAQYRPDDRRVVGPNAFQLNLPPNGAESPRPAWVIRSGPALFQRSYQDWVSPPPRPPEPAVVTAPAPAPVAAAPDAVAPELPDGIAPVGAVVAQPLPSAAGGMPADPSASWGVGALPPIAGPAGAASP